MVNGIDNESGQRARGWRRRNCVRLWCGSWDSGGGGSYHVAVVEYSSVDSNDEGKGGLLDGRKEYGWMDQRIDGVGGLMGKVDGGRVW